MASLQEFHKDVDTRENVHQFLIECVTKKMVEVGFAHGDTKPIAEAKEIIDGMFESLDNMFVPRKEEKEIVNNSR
jgi:hypothetical protein